MRKFSVTGLSWVGVGTDDFDRAMGFFRDTLGFNVETDTDQQAILRINDHQRLEIFGREGRGKSLNTPPTVAFEVDDFDAAHAALLADQIEIVGEVGEWNGHKWLYFRSPDGHQFEIKTSPSTH